MDSRFKTMRHIEATRNFINRVILHLIHRSEHHDQSKLRSPELEIFDEYTPKLRNVTYDSDEYRKNMIEMKPAIDHHNAVNRHHPEHFKNGISDMNLIDLTEMLCDWKAASLRHDDGDVLISLEKNQKKFGYSDELKQILLNTVCVLEGTYHRANES